MVIKTINKLMPRIILFVFIAYEFIVIYILNKKLVFFVKKSMIFVRFYWFYIDLSGYHRYYIL